MPELPEVETVVRQLDRKLSGKKIKDVIFYFDGRLKEPADSLKGKLIGNNLKSVKRRAKLILMEFEDGFLISHLKMTGKWLFDRGDFADRHIHAEIVLESGESVFWSDVRKFGYLEWVDACDLDDRLSGYGPEPLESSAEDLLFVLDAPKTRSIKKALLDQSVIAGVGNIYADEACFLAGVRPTRKLGIISKKKKIRILEELQGILRESIKRKGTTAHNYTDTEGQRGSFVELLKVYGREGKDCVTCGAVVKKIRHAGRGTHYCPRCQS